VGDAPRRALLRALDEVEVREAAPIDVVLAPDDPLAHSRLIGRIADAGPAMIVDPYFRLDQLMPIAVNAEVGRILTSDKTSSGERAALADAVSHRLTLGRPFEVRVSPGSEMHDRFIVPDAGPIQFIGASLNRVGRVLTVAARCTPVRTHCAKTSRGCGRAPSHWRLPGQLLQMAR